MPTYTAYFDGCCSPNAPGGTVTYGAYILHTGKTLWKCSKVYHPPPGKERHTSSNVGEYLGFIAALQELLNRNAQHEPVLVKGDSRMVIEQMFGTWQIKDGVYAPWAHSARLLLTRFTKLTGQWIPRTDNTRADALARQALRQALSRAT
jgi:ribonuclease HI